MGLSRRNEPRGKLAERTRGGSVANKPARGRANRTASKARSGPNRVGCGPDPAGLTQRRSRRTPSRLSPQKRQDGPFEGGRREALLSQALDRGAGPGGRLGAPPTEPMVAVCLRTLMTPSSSGTARGPLVTAAGDRCGMSRGLGVGGDADAPSCTLFTHRWDPATSGRALRGTSHSRGFPLPPLASCVPAPTFAPGRLCRGLSLASRSGPPQAPAAARGPSDASPFHT